MNPDLTRLKQGLEDLVGFDTQNPPGREVEAADNIEHRLREAGCEVKTDEFIPGRSNVVGVINNGPGPVFAFNTHIDVVPAGEGWVTDPFSLRQKGEELFGRGACDAKGPLICMLEAMHMLVENKDKWSGTLMGIFVADEEAASLGAKEYVKSAPDIDYCMIGEPTSCTTVTAHKGSIRPVVRIKGKTAHSGMPDLGVNAILKSSRLLELIVAEHEQLRTMSHPLVGQPSLTVTRALGGHADNVVPESCEFLLDRRLIPGEEEDAVKQNLLDLVIRAGKECGVEAEITEFRPTTGGATETASDHPVVMASQKACQHHHGHESPLTGFQGGCDLVHFRSVGANGVVLGPGSLEVAHQPNEFVPIDELDRATRIYHDVALTMLGGGNLPDAVGIARETGL